MSLVTNVMLVTLGPVDECVKLLNDHVAKDECCSGGQLVDVTEHAGGTKAMECSVYMAAFNYLQVDEFVEAARKAPWPEPSWIQLLIKQQDDDLFTDRLRETP